MSIFVEIDPQVRVDQGDVFADIYFPAIDAYVNAVVITPTCDLEHEKAIFLKFVSTIPSYVIIKTIAESLGINESVFKSGEALPKRQCDRLVNALRHNTTGDFLPRFYLLPEHADILPASYLDFQRVFAIPFLQVVEEYIDNRVARIVSPWREQILARYAGYSMRVGVPDYSDDELKDILITAGIKLPT